MTVFAFAPVQFSEWGWLFGFALLSLTLVGLAVLADALYEGYQARMHRDRIKSKPWERADSKKISEATDSNPPTKKAA